jgi:hypothetical protein
MEIAPQEAAEILKQIQQNQWKWVAVKRFVPENYPTAEERYSALDKHHAEETGRMIEIIQALCQSLARRTREEFERFLTAVPDREPAETDRVLE